jgi:hypothetical protein
LHDTYSFTATEGATYDIFSTSYYDPIILLLYDQYGNTIVANSETDDGSDIFLVDAYYSQDIILNWVAPYTGTYYVSASWNQGSYFKYYSLSIYENKDTAVSDTMAPTIALSANTASIGVGGSATINFVLSESSTNFTASDVEVTGGTLSNFNGSSTTYSAVFTPFENSTENGVVRVASFKFSDSAGNYNTDGMDSNNSVSMLVNTLSSSNNTTETNSIDILVNQGILGSAPVLLKDLTENVTYRNGVESGHTITYGTAVFSYSSIDSLITTVVRNGEFTAEFSQEIADFVPSAAGITYYDAVLLVGTQNIDSVLITVAGADGNYVL